ncbi:MAG: flagellar assembly protein FliW [Deltaproteobacteria bacterium]|nr:flagellar assembly protein FliW [Deltaproteobacteria bacterium]
MRLSKLKIETTRFGTVTLGEEKILNMPFGMLGFPDKQRFAILQHKENSPFFWYQSVNDPALAFVIISPFLFMPDYEVDIEDVLTEMSWDKKGENNGLEFYVVVNIPKGLPEKMTANLIGPILINNKTRQAVQMVISKSPYVHNFPLIIQNE